MHKHKWRILMKRKKHIQCSELSSKHHKSSTKNKSTIEAWFLPRRKAHSPIKLIRIHIPESNLNTNILHKCKLASVLKINRASAIYSLRWQYAIQTLFSNCVDIELQIITDSNAITNSFAQRNKNQISNWQLANVTYCSSTCRVALQPRIIQRIPPNVQNFSFDEESKSRICALRSPASNHIFHAYEKIQEYLNWRKFHWFLEKFCIQ